MSRKKPALYILTVTYPGVPRVEGSLRLNILGKDVAEETARELTREGCDVDWQAHGYSIYRTAAEALAEARSHGRYLGILKQATETRRSELDAALDKPHVERPLAAHHLDRLGTYRRPRR
jgi:hypothetical protein